MSEAAASPECSHVFSSKSRPIIQFVPPQGPSLSPCHFPHPPTLPKYTWPRPSYRTTKHLVIPCLSPSGPHAASAHATAPNNPPLALTRLCQAAPPCPPPAPHRRMPHGPITSTQRGEPWVWRWKPLLGSRGASALNACVHAVDGGAGAGTDEKIEVSSRYLAIFHIVKNLRACIHVSAGSVRDCVNTRGAPTPTPPPPAPLPHPHTQTWCQPSHASLVRPKEPAVDAEPVRGVCT